MRANCPASDDNHIKQALATVLNHVLKFRAVVGLAEKARSMQVAQDGDIVLSAKTVHSDLAFNAFFPLIIGGIGITAFIFFNLLVLRI